MLSDDEIQNRPGFKGCAISTWPRWRIPTLFLVVTGFGILRAIDPSATISCRVRADSAFMSLNDGIVPRSEVELEHPDAEPDAENLGFWISWRNQPYGYFIQLTSIDQS